MDSESDRALQTILSEHLEDGLRARDALGLHRRDRRPLILRILQIAEDLRPNFEGARIVAILVDPEVFPEPSPDLLQQLFGLTRKEAHVATQIMRGSTLQDIAAESGTGVGTVKAQTKAIFSKTGTNRQAQLVGLLTRLATISRTEE